MIKKSPAKVLFEGILSILIFLVLLGIANIVSNSIINFNLNTIIDFFNENLLFILSVSILIFFGDLFKSFIFPFNIVYPWFNALGGLLWVELFFRILELIDVLISFSISKIFIPFYFLIMFLVFVIVLVVGYVQIISSFSKKKITELNSKEKTEEEVCNDFKWGDIREEFRKVAYNIASSLKETFKPVKKRKK